MKSRISGSDELSAAWSAFCERINDMGRKILTEGFPGAGENPEAGFRMLANLVSVGIQWNLNFSDPEHPAFYRITDDVTRIASSNADMLYLFARIRSDLTYRISGKTRGADFSVEVIINHDFSSYEGMRTPVSLNASECEIRPDGSFEIYVGTVKHGKNFIETDPEWKNVLILLREYHDDWENTPKGEYNIDLVPPADLPPFFSGAEMIGVMEETVGWVERAADTFGRFADHIPNSVHENQIPALSFLAEGGRFLSYAFGKYRLAGDEAMIIEFAPPAAYFYSFQTNNLWGEPQDWANRITSLNTNQISVDTDGMVRIILAHADPGVRNWLDTAGFAKGMIVHRARLLAPTDAPKCTVLPFAHIRDHLPSETPTISREERNAQISGRRAAIARRFRN